MVVMSRGLLPVLTRFRVCVSASMIVLAYSLAARPELVSVILRGDLRGDLRGIMRGTCGVHAGSLVIFGCHVSRVIAGFRLLASDFYLLVQINSPK